MTDTDLTTSIYNDANPSNSNVLYSGLYCSSSAYGAGVPFAQNNAKVSFFTPDIKSVVVDNYNGFIPNEIACVPNIANALSLETKDSNSYVINWGSSNSLVEEFHKESQSFELISSDGTSKFITVCPTPNSEGIIPLKTEPITDNWYIYNKYCSSSTNKDLTTADSNGTNINSINISLPFNKCITMLSPIYRNNSGYSFLTVDDYNSMTIQTVSIINNNLNNVTVNPKLYLGTTTKSTSSSINNPYGVRVTIRDTIYSTELTSNAINNKIYYINGASNIPAQISGLNLIGGNSTIQPGQITLSHGQVLDISLIKLVETIDENVVDSNDSSILFVDLDNLVYTAPSLTLTTTNNVTTYKYNNLNQMEFKCQTTPNNINGDNLVGKKLQLYINNILRTSAIVDSTGLATFNITDKRLLTPGNYTAYVKYDTTLSENKLYSNSLGYPDEKAHYISGNSNNLSFTVAKQELKIEYFGTLRSPAVYSIIEDWNFSQWNIYDKDTNTLLATHANGSMSYPDNSDGALLLNGIWFNCKIDRVASDGVTHDMGAHHLNGQSPKDFRFTPPTSISFGYNYDFYVELNSGSSSTFSATISPYYRISTEMPIVTSQLLDMNNAPITASTAISYTTKFKYIITVKDSANRLYSYDQLRQSLAYAPLYNALDISPSIGYDQASKTFISGDYSPKALRLLRVPSTKTLYDSIPYVAIRSIDNYPSQQLFSQNTNAFTFNGVEYISSVNKLSPNIYEQVNAFAFIKDKTSNTIYSKDDISYDVTFSLSNDTTSYFEQNIQTQNSDNKYAYSFTPDDLSINTSNNPLTFNTQFVFDGAEGLITINDSKTINIASINPTIVVSPTSEVNDYKYGQDFTVTLTGLVGKNDAGTLHLYGTSSSVPVATISNALLNNVYHFTNIDIDALVGDAALSTLNLNQQINGHVTWVPSTANMYTYGTVQTEFSITLSKTETIIDNITINNNYCNFENIIQVTGAINSTYDETIDGVVQLFKSTDLNTIISQTNVVGVKTFSLDVSSNSVASYNFILKFVPTYSNVYADATNNSISNFIQFTKVIINPIFVITNLNTNLEVSSSINYTHNFVVTVNGLTKLDNSNVKVKIGTQYTSEIITIINGTVTTNAINFVNVNKVSSGSINTAKTIALEFTNYDTTKYSIDVPSKTLLFTKELSKPSFDSINITLLNSTDPVTSLYYESSFKIDGTFTLINNSLGEIIPITGILNLYVGTDATPIVLNNALTLTSTTQTIVNNFVPSAYGIYAGQKEFKFEFVPNDTNISSSIIGPLSYTITASTLENVSLTFPTSVTTYYGQSFVGSLSYLNNGATGSIQIYCKDPSNVSNQLLSTVNLTPTVNNKNTILTYSVTCAPIQFDCINSITSFDLIIKYVSNDTTRYRDNIMATTVSYNISKMIPKLSVVNAVIPPSVTSVSILSYNTLGISLNQTLTISGTIVTSNNTAVNGGKIELLLRRTVTNGTYSNTQDNTLRLTNGTRDTTTNTDYVIVNSNGTFSASFIANSETNSYFSSSTGSTSIQILYRNDKNYTERYFPTAASPSGGQKGVWGLSILKKNILPSETLFTIDKSNITNNYVYPYQEDSIKFKLEILKPLSELTGSSVYMELKNGITLIGKGNTNANNLNPVSGKYWLTLTSSTKVINNITQDICIAELILNPKTENIPAGTDAYSNSGTQYSAIFYITNSPSYNNYSENLCSSINNSYIYFQVQKTLPVFDITIKNPISGLTTSTVNYEDNVNIEVKVNTRYAIQNGVNQNRNINGTFRLRNQTNRYNIDGALMNLKKTDGEPVNSYTFTDALLSTSGIILNYAPKNNCDKFIDLVTMIYSEFTPTDSISYNSAGASPSLSITKYTPELTLNTIAVVNDVTHSAPINGVDDKNVYYDNNGNALYNGVINYDEQFQVTTTLSKNIGGMIIYYYSSSNASNANWIQVNPIITTNTGILTNGEQAFESQQFTATFNKQLIPIPANHVYFMKAIFYPTVNDTANNSSTSTYYNSDESSLISFNVYQANEFGIGQLFWNSVTNTTLSNTCSYTSTQNIDVAIQFTFKDTSYMSQRRVAVNLYHTNFDSESNKFYGPIYLDGTTATSNIVSTVVSIPANILKFKSDAYTIRALFTPVLSNDINDRNKNYPVVPEIGPISLIVKPFITSSQNNFNYQYSDSIPLTVTFNAGSGITDISPYSNLYINVSNRTLTDAYSTQSIVSFTGVSKTFASFNEIINGLNGNLKPGNYVVSMYATNNVNSSIVRTETFTTNFTISKKQVTMTLTFDKYNLSYRQTNTLYVNIGNYPLNNGQVHVAFQNAKNQWAVANCYINASQLVEVTPNSNSYKFEIADMSTFMGAGPGAFKVSADIDNIYYQGAQGDIADKRMIVTQEQNTAIVLSQKVFDVAYGSAITINAATKYNGSEIINVGQLNLSINNGEFANVSRSFIIQPSQLVKDINNLVLSYVDTTNSYVIKSVPFQVNVIKQTIAQPVLTYSVADNTDSTFKLHLTGIANDDTVTFYRLSSVSKLIPTIIASGVYTFNLTDLAYGDNTIYAVVRSATYDIDSTQVNVVRNKYDVSISLFDTTFGTTYRANSVIPTIKYKVSKNLNIYEDISNNGMVEFHKIIYANDGVTIHHDEIIGYATVMNNIATLANIKLVANSIVSQSGQYYDSKIKFYAKFNGSNDYNDAETQKTDLITITTKDATRLLDDNALSATYKLGDTITLGYIALKPSVSMNDEDSDVQAIVDAEQAAMAARSAANAAYTSAKAIYDVADKALTDANTAVSNANTALTNAVSNKNAAYSELLAAQSAVSTAKTSLSSVAANKDASELSFRIIQEVSKLSALETTLSEAQNRIEYSELDYNSTDGQYQLRLTTYNNAIAAVNTAQTAYDSAVTALRTAENDRDAALVDVINKESLYNTAQVAYQTALDTSKNALSAIAAKQAEILTLTNHIVDIEDNYDTKKADYDPKKADYDTKKAAFDLVKVQLETDVTTTTNAYNTAQLDYDTNYTTYNNTNNANQQTVWTAETAANEQINASFTLAQLTGMWAVIDQQSTNSTAQNPFFVVYTLKDTVTANASWYKSKLFYGSNANATTVGPMLLYTGADPTTVHPEITNRVELILDSSLSAGLQDSTEIVKAITIQTSSNMSSTQVDDYNFIFKEFGTTGSTSNATVSFIPTSSNNTVSVYADGVQGTNVIDGWAFNNNALTADNKMPKINWYVKYNASEETIAARKTAYDNKATSQAVLDNLVTTRNSTETAKNAAVAAYNAAKDPVDTAKSLVDASWLLFEPVKTDYDTSTSNKTAKEGQLTALQTESTNATNALPSLLTAMNLAKDNVDTANINKDIKQGLFVSKTNDVTSKLSLLNSAKSVLTVTTYGITIVQDKDNWLALRNDKYVMWKAYVKYVSILQDNPTNVDRVIYDLINQESAAYAANYTNWKNALSNMKSKETTYNSKVTAWTTAGTNLSNAEKLKSDLYDDWRAKQAIEIAAYGSKNTAATTYDNAKNASDMLLYPIAITSGYVEFYKNVVNNGTTMTEIIGKVPLSVFNRGLVSLEHKLVDLGQVTFYGRLTDLPNYYDSQSTNVSVNVFERYDTNIINGSTFNAELYKVGDSVTLNYSVVKNNVQQTPVTDGQLAIYKKIGDNEQLLKYYQITSSNNGVIQHTHTLVDSGSVKFFAKYIYSTNNEDEIGAEQSISVLNKLNTTISDIAVSAEPYKLGSNINLKYQLTSVNVRNISGLATLRTDNIESGLVEFHKCVGATDEMIGYVTLASGSNGIAELNYQLIDTGAVSFYIKYMGTQEYESKSNESIKRIVSVADKFVVSVTNTSGLASGVSKKLGSIISLNYAVYYGAVAVNEGLMEIKKSVTVNGKVFDEILGYAEVKNGSSTFAYKLTDIDTEITIVAKYVNSINYREAVNAPVTQNIINVFSKYASKIVRTSALNSGYKLGDSIILEYAATNMDNQALIVDGIVSIHKKTTNVSGTTTDEILHYATPQNGTGKVSYIYKLDTLDTVKFYATFNDSADYYDSVSIEETIDIVKEYTSATNTLTLSSLSPSYASNVTLTSSIVDGVKTINEGVVAFYATLPGKPAELIGVANVNANVSTLNYMINDMGTITFSSVFKNSSNYVDVSSSNVIATVSKADIQSIALSSISGMEFDIVTVTATVTYGKELCYKNLGKVEFKVTNNSNTIVANVDVIGSVATYKLYVSNKMPFTVESKFLGNELFNESSADTKTFTPIANDNYKELVYTKTAFDAMDNHYTINATIGLNDATVDEKFMLLNTGFVLFRAIKIADSSVDASKSVAMPLVNGSAKCIVRQDADYSFEVKYVDEIQNPNVSLVGTIATA